MAHANGERIGSPVVAVTGASAGIGRAIALSFARERAAVAVCARREAQLREVAAAVEYRLSKGLAVLGVIAPSLCDRIVHRWRREPIAAPSSNL